MIATIITLVVAGAASTLALRSARLARLWQAVAARITPLHVVVWGCGFFIVVVGGMALLRHWAFGSNALDMGLMDQIVWNSAHGRWFEESFLTGQPASFLGHHFSPALALLVPFYWLLPRAETLIVVQIGCIVGSALLLGRVAFTLGRQAWIAAALVVMVLLHPLVQDAALFDFHQDAVGMFFLALGIWGITEQRWRVAALGWLVSLLAKEEIAIYWMAIGLFGLVVGPRGRGWKALFVLVNALWLYGVIAFVIPALQTGAEAGFSFFARYAYWGDNVGAAVRTFLDKPIDSLRFLLLPDRIGGLGMMLLPVLPFLLGGRWPILLLLLPLGINTLADYVGQHNYRFHYSLLPIVMIVYACGWAIHFMQPRHARVTPRLIQATVFMAVASLMLFVGVSQIGLRFPRTLLNYLPDEHVRRGHHVVAMIPADASVIAQNKLVAHLSQRQWITLLSRQLATPPDYYLLDLQSSPAPQSTTEYLAEIDILLANSAYGVAHLEDGYILLARDVPWDAQDVAAAHQMVEQFHTRLDAP